MPGRTHRPSASQPVSNNRERLALAATLGRWSAWLHRGTRGRAVAFVLLGRPLFLTGGVLLYTLGALVALWAGARLNVVALIIGQVAVTSIQWMTHYANDYFDLAGDRLNRAATLWSGSSQVLPKGWLSPRVALITALVMAAVALSASAVLALDVRPGLLTLVLFVVPLVLAWGYSAPPLKLHSRGLGELTVVLLVSTLLPLTGFYLQAGSLAPLPLLAAAPLCFLQFGMMLGVALPDVESDAAVGKQTLPVRLGRTGAARLYVLALLAAYASLPLVVLAGLPLPVAAAACLSLPFAAWLAWRLVRADWTKPRRWGGLVFSGIALLIGTAALEWLTFAVLVWLEPVPALWGR